MNYILKYFGQNEWIYVGVWAKTPEEAIAISNRTEKLEGIYVKVERK